MAQPLDVKHLLATGKQFSDSGRSQARQLGSDLVSQGRQATEQIAARIDDLAGRASRERIEELLQSLRGDVQRELRMLRELLTVDLARVEGAVDRIGAAVSEARNERREREEELRESMRDELQRQLSLLGLATREDVAALGRSLREDLAESLTRRSEPDARPEGAMQVTPPHQQPPTT